MGDHEELLSRAHQIHDAHFHGQGAAASHDEGLARGRLAEGSEVLQGSLELCHEGGEDVGNRGLCQREQDIGVDRRGAWNHGKDLFDHVIFSLWVNLG